MLDRNVKNLVIVDRDGTIARIDRDGFRLGVDDPDPDWDGYHKSLPFDTPIPAVVNLVNALDEDVLVFITTGRSESLRWPMVQWLHKHEIRYDRLLMRPVNDQRADHEVKRDLYLDHIEGRYNVLFVVDDRPSVCDMWRSLGLPLIQVAQPEEVPPFQFLGGY